MDLWVVDGVVGDQVTDMTLIGLVIRSEPQHWRRRVTVTEMTGYSRRQVKLRPREVDKRYSLN